MLSKFIQLAFRHMLIAVSQRIASHASECKSTMVAK